MTVKVTKDALNLREKLSELDKPSGIAGQDILKADTPQEVFNYIGAGRRNLIINGAMQVAQRGTSFSGTNAYTLDRWLVDATQDGGGQVADAPDDFEYSLKINPSSGNAVLRQAIELPAAGKGGLFRSGQTFTLSFWLKSDNAGEAINIFIASATGVQGTTTTYVSDTSTGLTTSTSWTKYTYTYTQSSDVGGSDTCYNIVPYVSSPSGAIYITGVQLEVGSVATPFEHRSYGEELALCQRYYFKSYNQGVDPGTATVAGMFRTAFRENGQGTGYIEMYSFRTPCEMRSTPAITVYDGAGTVNKCSLYSGTSVSNGHSFTKAADGTSSFGGYTDRTTQKGGFAIHVTLDAEL